MAKTPIIKSTDIIPGKLYLILAKGQREPETFVCTDEPGWNRGKLELTKIYNGWYFCTAKFLNKTLSPRTIRLYSKEDHFEVGVRTEVVEFSESWLFNRYRTQQQHTMQH